MKNQGNVMHPKEHNYSLATHAKEIQMDEISDKEFKGMIAKTLNEIQENTVKIVK
jgi:hypothetical protein